MNLGSRTILTILIVSATVFCGAILYRDKIIDAIRNKQPMQQPESSGKPEHSTPNFLDYSQMINAVFKSVNDGKWCLVSSLFCKHGSVCQLFRCVPSESPRHGKPRLLEDTHSIISSEGNNGTSLNKSNEKTGAPKTPMTTNRNHMSLLLRILLQTPPSTKVISNHVPDIIVANVKSRLNNSLVNISNPSQLSHYVTEKATEQFFKSIRKHAPRDDADPPEFPISSIKHFFNDTEILYDNRDNDFSSLLSILMAEIGAADSNNSLSEQIIYQLLSGNTSMVDIDKAVSDEIFNQVFYGPTTINDINKSISDKIIDQLLNGNTSLGGTYVNNEEKIFTEKIFNQLMTGNDSIGSMTNGKMKRLSPKTIYHLIKVLSIHIKNMYRNNNTSRKTDDEIKQVSDKAEIKKRLVTNDFIIEIPTDVLNISTYTNSLSKYKRSLNSKTALSEENIVNIHNDKNKHDLDKIKIIKRSVIHNLSTENPSVTLNIPTYTKPLPRYKRSLNSKTDISEKNIVNIDSDKNKQDLDKTKIMKRSVKHNLSIKNPGVTLNIPTHTKSHFKYKRSLNSKTAISEEDIVKIDLDKNKHDLDKTKIIKRSVIQNLSTENSSVTLNISTYRKPLLKYKRSLNSKTAISEEDIANINNDKNKHDLDTTKIIKSTVIYNLSTENPSVTLNIPTYTYPLLKYNRSLNSKTDVSEQNFGNIDHDNKRGDLHKVKIMKRSVIQNLSTENPSVTLNIPTYTKPLLKYKRSLNSKTDVSEQNIGNIDHDNKKGDLDKVKIMKRSVIHNLSTENPSVTLNIPTYTKPLLKYKRSLNSKTDVSEVNIGNIDHDKKPGDLDKVKITKRSVIQNLSYENPSVTLNIPTYTKPFLKYKRSLNSRTDTSEEDIVNIDHDKNKHDLDKSKIIKRTVMHNLSIENPNVTLNISTYTKPLLKYKRSLNSKTAISEENIVNIDHDKNKHDLNKPENLKRSVINNLSTENSSVTLNIPTYTKPLLKYKRSLNSKTAITKDNIGNIDHYKNKHDNVQIMKRSVIHNLSIENPSVTLNISKYTKPILKYKRSLNSKTDISEKNIANIDSDKNKQDLDKTKIMKRSVIHNLSTGNPGVAVNIPTYMKPLLKYKRSLNSKNDISEENIVNIDHDKNKHDNVQIMKRSVVRNLSIENPSVALNIPTYIKPLLMYKKSLNSMTDNNEENILKVVNYTNMEGLDETEIVNQSVINNLFTKDPNVAQDVSTDTKTPSRKPKSLNSVNDTSDDNIVIVDKCVEESDKGKIVKRLTERDVITGKSKAALNIQQYTVGPDRKLKSLYSMYDIDDGINVNINDDPVAKTIFEVVFPSVTFPEQFYNNKEAEFATESFFPMAESEIFSQDSTAQYHNPTTETPKGKGLKDL